MVSLKLSGVVTLLTHLGFALSTPVEGASPPSSKTRAAPISLGIDSATLTSKWIEGSDLVQIIEMVLTNHDSENSFTKSDNLTVTASSSFFDVIKPATVTRLMAGQQIVVQIGVKNKAGVAQGSVCSATISANWAGSQTATSSISGTCGFGDYTATKSSLNHHWTPDWYNNAKFGIFIHWGVYSVPAFGNVGNREECWWWMVLMYVS